MARIVPEACKIESTKALIVVEGADENELHSQQVREAIHKTARDHLGRCGFSDLSLPGAYPVDAEGKTDDDLVLGRRQGVAAYRVDYQFTQSL